MSSQQEIFHSLPIYMKTIHAKQAKLHIVYLVHGDQLGIMAKHLT